jgi:hypothetical protein
VNDQVFLGINDQFPIAVNRYLLGSRIQNDLVLLGLVDNDNAFASFFVIEDDAMTGPRFDQLGVVLAGFVVLDRRLFCAPERADHDRAIDIAVLEDHEDFVVDLGQKVGTPIFSRHRYGDPRPEGLLFLFKPRELDLDLETRIVLPVFVVGDDRQMHATQLVGALRL